MRVTHHGKKWIPWLLIPFTINQEKVGFNGYGVAWFSWVISNWAQVNLACRDQQRQTQVDKES